MKKIIIVLGLVFGVVAYGLAAPKSSQVEDAKWCGIVADIAKSVQEDRVRHHPKLYEYLTAIDEEIGVDDVYLAIIKSIVVTVFNHHSITDSPTDVWAIEFGSCINERIKGTREILS